MKDHSKISDFEINSAVYNFALDLGYDLTFLGEDVIEWRKDGEVITTGNVDYTKNGLRDYCNNPSDAWPIIIENKIRISPVMHMSDDNGEYLCNGEWEAGTLWSEDGAFYNSKYHCFSDVNPFRAAMIVYLMMKDEEK